MLNNHLDLQQFYQKSKCEVADLTFFDEEIKFLKFVLEKLLVKPVIDDIVQNQKLHHINNRFVQLKFIRNNVLKDVLEHQGKLASIIRESNIRDWETLQQENERLDLEIKDIHKIFKDIKKDIIALFKSTHQLIN